MHGAFWEQTCIQTASLTSWPHDFGSVIKVSELKWPPCKKEKAIFTHRLLEDRNVEHDYEVPNLVPHPE